MTLNKKTFVASFQRSGTHFLINTLASNFENIEDGWVDVVHSPKNCWVSGLNRRNLREKIREQLLERYFPHPTRKCLKTHYQAYFFERHMAEILEKYNILYMTRDPRDVLVACFHYYNRTRFERFIQEPNFSSFIRKSLWDVRSETSPLSYSYVKPCNIVDKLNKHILSWLSHKDRGVTFVRFSELKNQLIETLRGIERRTALKLKPTIVEVSISDRRYRPDYHDGAVPRGQVGMWKDYFSAEDLAFVDQMLSNDVKLACYDTYA